MKIKGLIFTLTFSFLTISLAAQVHERTKYKMFCTALNNHSTSPNYVVINVKNLETGETKEICTEAPFISGAMGYENEDWSTNYKKYGTRYFEFRKDSALLNINFNLYSTIDLEEYAKSIKIDSLVEEVKNGRLYTKTFLVTRKEQTMFAHLMFNYGIMMTRGCIAGNICSLNYYKKE